METSTVRIMAPSFASDLPRAVFVWLTPGEYAELMAYMFWGTVDFEV